MRKTPTTAPLEGPEHEHLLVQRFRLLVEDGPDRGVIYTTRRERVIIGTHKSADLVLHDPTMSRFHCEIALAEGQPMVRDLGSRNGTFVSDVCIKSAALAHLQRLRLGRTKLRFEVGDKDVKIPLSERQRFGSLVGQSAAMRALFARLEHAASSNTTVLLLGETGTGKDLAAEAIHREGERKDKPFVILDCGSIAPNLVESELFGHERGAFTGALQSRGGVFEAANGGTLFLDEIGELPLAVQPKLLRVLERGEVHRVGSGDRSEVDVRVIAATNRDLQADVNAKRFRADLYYRIAVLVVTLPPLRDRFEDLPVLIDELLAMMGMAERPQAAALRTDEFFTALKQHGWPGNVRELRNYLERILVTPDEPLEEGGPQGSPLDVRKPLRTVRREFERRYIAAVLQAAGGNVTEAARLAGIARMHFYRLMSRYGIR